MTEAEYGSVGRGDVVVDPVGVTWVVADVREFPPAPRRRWWQVRRPKDLRNGDVKRAFVVQRMIAFTGTPTSWELVALADDLRE